MKLSALLSIAAFAASALGTSPTPPVLTYLFSAHLDRAAPILIGTSPYGPRAVVPLTGGTFAGPKLQGTIAGGTATSLIGSQGTIKAEATYVLQTNDGANILVTERAAPPYVEVLFETGAAKYNWLNNVTAWATPRDLSDIEYLDFWQISR